jgi:L-lysine 2,3-aminomutase
VKQTWVLVGIEEEIPEKDVVELMKRYPDNKVILVTKKSLKVHCATCTKKKFQEKTFP